MNDHGLRFGEKISPGIEEVSWYVRRSHQVSGPFSVEELARLVARTSVAVYDEVRVGADGEWVSAREVIECLQAGAAGQMGSVGAESSGVEEENQSAVDPASGWPGLGAGAEAGLVEMSRDAAPSPRPSPPLGASKEVPGVASGGEGVGGEPDAHRVAGEILAQQPWRIVERIERDEPLPPKVTCSRFDLSAVVTVARETVLGLGDLALTGVLKALQWFWVQAAAAMVVVAVLLWKVVLPQLPVDATALLVDYRATLHSLQRARERSAGTSIRWSALEQEVAQVNDSRLERLKQGASSRRPELLELQQAAALFPAVLEEVREPRASAGPAETKVAMHLANTAKELERQGVINERELTRRQRERARGGLTLDNFVFWGLGIIDAVLFVWFARWAYQRWFPRPKAFARS